MTFNLTFDMDNDAFDGYDALRSEVAKILHDVKNGLSSSALLDFYKFKGVYRKYIMDSNGNSIGQLTISED